MVRTIYSILRCYYILITSRLSGQFLVSYIYVYNVPCDVYVTGRRFELTTEKATGATINGQAVHPKRDSLTIEAETDRLFRNVGN